MYVGKAVAFQISPDRDKWDLHELSGQSRRLLARFPSKEAAMAYAQARLGRKTPAKSRKGAKAGSGKPKGHKGMCACVVCANRRRATRKARLQAYAPKLREELKVPRGHKPGCGCVVCARRPKAISAGRPVRGALMQGVA